MQVFGGQDTALILGAMHYMHLQDTPNTRVLLTR